jgi:hypothetical protein
MVGHRVTAYRLALLGMALAAAMVSCDAVLGIQQYGPGAQGDGGEDATADSSAREDSGPGTDSSGTDSSGADSSDRDAPGGDASSGDTGLADAGVGDAGTSDAASDSGPPPAITCVQFTAGGGTTTAMRGVPFNNPVQAHDAVIVGIVVTTGSGPSTIDTITDSLGNAYQTVLGPVLPSLDAGNSGTTLYLAFAGDIAGGSDSVTVKLSTAAYLDVYIHEYSGLALSGAFDVGAGASGTSDVSNAMSSGPASTHASHELVFGFGASAMTSAGSGFTARSTFDTNITEDEVVTSSGSYQATATAGNLTGWIMTMATFRGQ